MSSVERFNRTLENRTSVFSQRLDEMVASFAATDETKQRKKAAALAESGQTLVEMLTQTDRPTWIVPIRDAARVYVSNSNASTGKALLTTIAQHYGKVGPITIADTLLDYDFDKLYERLRNEGRLPELFDRMIKAVSEMLERDEIDSVTVVTALSRLLEILKANRDGSYGAVSQTVLYANFVGNLAMGFLKQIPILGTFVEAYEVTAKEMRDELDRLQQDFRDHAIQVILGEKMKARLEQMPHQTPLLLEVTAATEERESQEPGTVEQEAPQTAPDT